MPARFFSFTGHVLFAHWKILSIIRTFFRSSAQYTFSTNRKTYIFYSLTQHPFSIYRYSALSPLSGTAQKKVRKSHDFRTPICKNTKYYFLMLLLLPNPERWHPERQHQHLSTEKGVILFFPCKYSGHCLPELSG